MPPYISPDRAPRGINGAALAPGGRGENTRAGGHLCWFTKEVNFECHLLYILGGSGVFLFVLLLKMCVII